MGRKEKLEMELAQESQKLQLNLNPKQVAEYRRLKAEVEKRSAIVSGNLDNKLQDQEINKSAIEVFNILNKRERVKMYFKLHKNKKNICCSSTNDASKHTTSESSRFIIFLDLESMCP
jgi:hypothetical protein